MDYRLNPSQIFSLSPRYISIRFSAIKYNLSVSKVYLSKNGIFYYESTNLLSIKKSFVLIEAPITLAYLSVSNEPKMLPQPISACYKSG